MPYLTAFLRGLRPLRLALAAICLFPAMSACGSGDDRFEKTDCGGIAIPRGQDEHAFCGWVTVARDHFAPGEGTIRLRVAVLRATGQYTVDDPLLYLSGGPGASALESDILAWTDSYAAPVQRERDIVFFDQRGTGQSSPLDCPEVDDAAVANLEQNVDLAEEVEDQLAALRVCRQRLDSESGGSLLPVSSAQSARDIRVIVDALGYDEYNLYGVSYGTRLALTVMRDVPGNLRAVILDSVYPPNVDVITGAPVSFTDALAKVFDGCAADTRCSAAHPDLRSTVAEGINRLNASPVTVRTAPLPGLGRVAVVMTGDRLAFAAFSSLYVTQVIPQLPSLLETASAGNTQALQLFATIQAAFIGTSSVGAYYAVQCGEEVPFASRTALDGTTLGDLPGELIAALDTVAADIDACEIWGTPDGADPRENEAVFSNKRTLILSGAFDPITPPAWAMVAADTLSRSEIVTFPANGHAILGDDCGIEVVAAFLAHPDAADTTCADALRPPRWR